MNDQSYLVRQNSAKALGEIGHVNEQITTALIQALQDKVDFVRKAVVYAIGQLGIFNTKEQLLKQLKVDPSVYVRRQIVGVLANISDKLTKIEIDYVFSDEDPGVQHFAPRFLKQFEASLENGDMDDHFEDIEYICSHKTPYETALLEIEEGNIYRIIRQAILDPRLIKRKAARSALWPMSV